MDAVNQQHEVDETRLLGLLRLRYGDGQIYMPRRSSRNTLQAARQLGLVNLEGFLTRKGRVFLAEHDSG